MQREQERLRRVSLNPEPTEFPPGDNGNGAPGEVGQLRRQVDSYVRHWTRIEAELPEDFNRHHIKFVKDYFRAQLRIAQGRNKKARRILTGLVDRTGYKEFEKANRPILAAIDIAVRGSSNWEDELKRKVEPAFRIDSG